MKKSDLVKVISASTGICKVDVLLVLENAFVEIKKNVKESNPVFIRGFGTFTTKVRAAKKARIFKSNEEIKLQAKTIPYFKPSKEFRKMISNQCADVTDKCAN